MREFGLTWSLGCAFLLVSCIGCDRSSPTPEGATSGVDAVTETETPIARDGTAKTPDSVEAFIERGKVSYRNASTKAWRERIELYQKAWEDLRKAHELAGGTWDFDFVPWEPPDSQPETISLPLGLSTESKAEGSALALTEAARMCLGRYRLDQAALLMERARTIEPDDPYVKLICLQIEGLATDEWSRINPKLRKLVEQPALNKNSTGWSVYGFGLMSARDYPAAEAAFLKSLELDTTQEGARSNLVYVLAAQDRMEEAEAVQAELRKGSDGLIYSDLNLGYTLMTKGRFEEGIPILESVTQRAPGLPMGWMNLAGCYAQTKRFEEAIRAYEMFTSLTPKEANGHGLLGHTYSQMGKYDEAIKVLKHAEQLPSATYSIQLGLAEAYQGLGQTQDAERVMQRALEMDPTADAVWNMYGNYLNERQRYDELIEKASAVIEKFPQKVAPYDWRATAYVDIGDLERALADKSKVIELAPNANSYLTRALIKKLAGRTNTEVLADLEAALTKYKGHAYVSAMLWVVARDTGNAKRADQAIREAAAKAEPNNWYGRITRYLMGDLSQDEFLDYATDDNLRCEAYYFIGEKTRLTSDFQKARSWFEKCVALDNERYWEHKLSELRLERQD